MNPIKRGKILDVYSVKDKILLSKLYIRELNVHPLEFSIGYDQTSFSRSPAEEKELLADFPFLSYTTKVVAFDGVTIMLNSFRATDVLDSAESLATRMAAKYISELLNQLIPLAGNLIINLDMLGRPAGLVKNVGSGLRNFFYQPVKGAMQSPYGLITGISQGTTTLVSEVVGSSFGSVSTIVDNASKTMVQGATFLTGDDEFSQQQQNMRAKTKRNQGGVLQGFKEGGEYMVTGLKDGVVGLIQKPIQGGKKGGVMGFLGGLGAGLVGGIVKPVVGLSSGVASITSGISQQVSADSKAIHFRPQRVFYRTDVDINDYALSPLDLNAAFVQNFLSRKSGDALEIFLDYSFYDYSIGGALVLSQRHLFNVIISDTKQDSIRVLKQWNWKNIQFFDIPMENEINIVLFNESSKKEPNPHFSVVCKDQESTMKTYSMLYKHADLVGNSGQMMRPEEVVSAYYSGSAKADLRAQDAPVYWGIYTCKFGSHNETALHSTMFSETNILESADSKFCGNWETIDPTLLDEKLWWLVSEWCQLHNGFYASFSRCCATLVLNSARTSIQIKQLKMVKGRDYRFFGEGGYRSDSKLVLPGGFVVIFAYSYAPSLLDNAHVKLSLSTTAFNAVISTKKNGTQCESLPGYSVGFLEKTFDEKWSKNVIHVANI
jgi:hypothetical protein